MRDRDRNRNRHQHGLCPSRGHAVRVQDVARDGGLAADRQGCLRAACRAVWARARADRKSDTGFLSRPSARKSCAETGRTGRGTRSDGWEGPRRVSRQMMARAAVPELAGWVEWVEPAAPLRLARHLSQAGGESWAPVSVLVHRE